ncbi:hypothetical protein TWF225_005710 [Orbilia oligospora]|uniref:Mannose-1-phosphate guanyltransferase n=1 Tax=Orbilia oligospora TaxID=2813651 RepID=A0A7C8PE34_ORBOL|nr:hypothetical protein TWF751_010354 [Orbilia oligospora]KAF3185234.1 hypothetical protein TWF225_005710 [Orbilia oligospora]KAF3244923.1 hypothetical protein TWF128_009626 [Orbilia oligospora]KAF3253890.1 hypothetical protein TWF217_007357 [Orbilia oligospora]KAF3293920.1 hypothetical protein TWF132_003812 [Orbilia oligospora]
MPSSHHALGLTVIILCGEGSDLKPISSSIKLPKALLPIANKPMIQYPLEWALDAGLDTIVIVCLSGQETAIRTAVNEIYATREPHPSAGKNPKPLQKPKIVGAASPGSRTGTADVLRHPQVYNHIKKDFMILSCDSICEIPATTIIKEWMLLPETVGDKKGALGVWYEVKKEKGVERDTIITGPVPRYDLESHLRTTEARTDPTTELTYLLQNFGSRTDDGKGDIEIRRSLFKHHPKVMYHSLYRDAHIYIFPAWSLKFILNNPRSKLKSIKDDVLTWWAKAGWQGSGLQAHNLGILDILSGEDGDDGRKSDSLSMASYHDDEVTEADVEKFLGLSSMGQSGHSTTPGAGKRKEINTRGWFPTKNKIPSPADSPISNSSGEKVFKKIKKPAYNGLFCPGVAVFKPKMTITPLATTPLIRRVDTLPLYLSTCLELARNPTYNTKPIHSSAVIDSKANVSNIDSMVGPGTKVEGKVLVKRSVIGKDVKIGASAKIQGCVILDGAQIGAGCKLEGCIIGRHATIGENSTLTSCQVIEDIYLRNGTVEKNQLITESSLPESDEEVDDVFDGGNDGAGDGEYESSEEDDEDDDDEEEDDDDATTTQSIPTTTKSIPTTSKEHVTQLSAVAPAPKTFDANYSIQETPDPKETVVEIPGMKDKQIEQTETEAGEEESGPTVPFSQLELQGEEDDEEDDFEPDSDDSSFCAEEYDSNFESDGLVSGDDTGNLSGPEEDGGPLKSPKRISGNFSRDMSQSMAQMASMNLSAVMDGADKIDESKKESLPQVTEVSEVKKDVEITPSNN